MFYETVIPVKSVVLFFAFVGGQRFSDSVFYPLFLAVKDISTRYLSVTQTTKIPDPDTGTVQRLYQNGPFTANVAIVVQYKQQKQQMNETLPI